MVLSDVTAGVSKPAVRIVHKTFSFVVRKGSVSMSRSETTACFNLMTGVFICHLSLSRDHQPLERGLGVISNQLQITAKYAGGK